jgi:hypothetical protein
MYVINMTIRHLVISDGGPPLGLRYLGALLFLYKNSNLF